ncbi:Mitochondrial import inner membrane translocase subunit TIM50 Flags: Precursor [Serendipita indica DSM 11827]|nr:Mitochondrial import inner membrane translocase subunit TIM50 Flags: Precursor [Serendipita indica DSM 11827]
MCLLTLPLRTFFTNDGGDSLQPSNSSPSSDATDAPLPSTPRVRQAFASLDFEPQEKLDGTSDSPSLITDGSTPSTGDARRMRTGAKSAKNSMSSIERRKRRLAWAGTIGFVGFLVGSWVYNGWDDDPKAEPGIRAWIARSNKNTLKMLDLFEKPISEKLLPDHTPEQSPYTLVISIDDLLISSVWDRQNGWRTAKRPGAEYFLGYLSQFYEIVIFTTQNWYTALPIMEQVDPFSYYATYQLYREATRTYKTHIVKDLSYLNRDLSKVVAIDTVADRYELQPDNAIIVPKWKPGKPGTGDNADGDAGLIGLIPFLESLVIYQVPDVRNVVKEYHNKDIPKEYAKIEALNKERSIKNWQERQKMGWSLGRVTGTANQPPRTLLEEQRAAAQRGYKLMQAELARQKPELDRLRKAEQEAQMKARSPLLARHP